MITPAALPQQPSGLKIIWLICQFELIRLFITKRGIVLVAAFAIIWFLILKYPVYQAANIMSNPNFLDNFMFFSQKLNLEYLLNWQSPELAVYWLIAAFSFPMISVLFSSDQTASDNTRGTLRFISLRANRNHILFGRFFGQLMIITALISMTILATWLMGLSRDPSALMTSGQELGLVFGNLIVLCLPFIGLMALFNAIFRSPRLSVVATIIVIPIVSSIINVASFYWPVLGNLLMVLPGQQLTRTVQSDGLSSLPMIILPLVQTVIYLALAQVVFNRRAI